MYSELITLLDKGGNAVILSALTVGFFFLKRKIEELCKRVSRLEDLLLGLRDRVDCLQNGSGGCQSGGKGCIEKEQLVRKNN